MQVFFWPNFFFKIFFFILCVGVFAYMYVYAHCVSVAHGGQKKVLDALLL